MESEMGTKRIALGKGLAALIPETKQEENKALLYCGIEEIFPNRSQPRKRFDESKLQELAESIRKQGILEPLIVRRTEQGYEIIVGERRWRAAQKAGLREIPILVKEVEGRDALEISLVENIQRENLNAVEEAEAYSRLIDEFGISQEELGARVGKDRTTVANSLRLLKLPPEVLEHLIERRITAGHARAMVGVDGKERQIELCKLAIEKGLSVRETEALAKNWARKPADPVASETQRTELSSQVTALQDILRRRLGTKVLVVPKGKKGKIEIEYYSNEELERIVEAIVGDQD
jgi:ParB family transcriptional regulator, chromosome partitioning protein